MLPAAPSAPARPSASAETVQRPAAGSTFAGGAEGEAVVGTGAVGVGVEVRGGPPEAGPDPQRAANRSAAPAWTSGLAKIGVTITI
jgi:hypothetical protein